MSASTASDPLQDFPGYLLRRISVAAMGDLARRLKPLRLRPAEASVLLIVEANRNVSQVTVGRMVDIAAPNMVALMAKLVERGLVERQPRDGRSHGLHLTSEGASVARKVRKAVLAHEEAILARIPAAQRSGFLAALRALWRSA
jgi:DNA-binding MarR family transcriptional regulator